MEPDCRHLVLLSHKSISEVDLRSANLLTASVQFPEVSLGVEVTALCRSVSFSHIKLGQALYY